MQLSELRTRTRTRIGSPTQTDVPDTPNLDQHINDAYQEILNKYKFKNRRKRGRFPTTIGAQRYDVSGLTDIIYKVWDRTNGRELERIGKTALSQQDYDASPNALVQNGKPAKWAYIETYLQILPPSDGVYVLEFVYKVRFVPLAGTVDVPVIPANWHRGIVILAAAMYYEDEGGDPAKAVFNHNAFKDWVSDQPVEEHEETESIDSGVEIPTLGGDMGKNRRPDGVWWDAQP